MGIHDIISLLGGLAVFLFGMSTMTSGLEKLASGKLTSLLEKMTDNIFKGVLLGAAVAGLVHSSAATTVMCVGFVNAGILKLRQAVGIIMGANIGTTVTAQILRISNISSSNIFLILLRPEMLGPILAFIGILFFSFFTGGRKKTVGQALLGMGLLFIGIKSMETALSAFTQLEAFQRAFIHFSNPFIGILVGAGVTALIQSSTASVALLQAMSSTGMITFSSAMPIIMGQNIGTCVTAIISCFGATPNAKRTAAVHLYFNVIGTVVFMTILYGINAVVGLPFWNDVMDYGYIANLHTFFNVACTLLLLPFNRLLVKLVEATIPGEETTNVVSALDPLFLSAPSVALDRARTVVIEMAELARENFHIAAGLFNKYDEKQLDLLQQQETALDHLEDALDQYLVKLSHQPMNIWDNDLTTDLLHALSDFERIGDYSVNLSESATTLHQEGITFSAEAKEELRYLFNAVFTALDDVLLSYRERDTQAAFRVEPLEEVIDLITATLRDRHVERLKTGACSVVAGTQFLEMLINLERISDHCSNAAVRIIRESSGKDDLVRKNTHTYLHNLHSGSSKEFDRQYEEAKEKYYIPIS